MTEYSIIDEIRKCVDDAVVSGTAGKYLTDAQMLAFVLRHATQEGIYQFTRLSHGYYSWPGQAYFFNPSFTEEDGCTYVFNSSGSIVVTELGSPDNGTDTRTSINVTACRVNFNRIVSDILLYLANQKAKIIAQSGDMGTVTPNTVRQELMAQASEWAIREWMEN